jgi:S1-C subfamily serine protease
VIWALLAILGVPIWLVVGGLTSALLSRRNFRAQDDVFALYFRDHGDDGWPRTVSWGRYVHNVLIVNHGLALVRTAIHVVEGAESLDVGTPPKKLTDPVAWALTLSDGERVDVAVSASDAEPLLAAMPPADENS